MTGVGSPRPSLSTSKLSQQPQS